MSEFVTVTEADLVRARTDPEFRHQLLADHLERLIESLNRLRNSRSPDGKRATQIREGALLAVKLADMIQAVEKDRKPHAA